MQKASCVVLVLALTGVAMVAGQTRPALPLNTYVEYGIFVCSSADGGFCAGGDANGLIRSWLEFDATTDLLINYREEAILNNSVLYYNREFATATTTHEFSLVNGMSQLTCFDMHAGGVINRHFLVNATFEGNTTIRGIPVWTYTGQWHARGPLLPYKAWVRMDIPTQILGWESGGATYLYLSYTDETAKGFPANTFVPPALNCSAPQPPQPPLPPANCTQPICPVCPSLPESEGMGSAHAKTAGAVFAGISAFEHVYFLVLEMILWRGRARKIFGTTAEYADSTAGLAANQGLYNGFLAAGIIYGLASENVVLITFSLACVIVAGVFGALTVGVKIFFIQSVPAILAIILTQYGYKPAGDWNKHNPFLTLLYVLCGVLVGGLGLGLFVCRRETALGSYNKKPKLADQEHAQP